MNNISTVQVSANSVLNVLTFEAPNMTNDVLINSPSCVPYFLYNTFGRIWLFNFHSLFHLINSSFLITSYIILFELCKEKFDVDKLPGAE